MATRWMLSFVLILAGITWCTEGALKFTQNPANPTYIQKGSDAILRWGYSVDNRTAELNEITWTVYNKTQGKANPLILEDSDGNFRFSRNIPQFYVGRVDKKEQATLVIKNVNFEDSTQFSCNLRGFTSAVASSVSIIVTGPPKFSDEVYFAKVGGSVTLTVNATNVPRQNFIWKRQQQEESIIVSDAQHSITSLTGFSQLTIKDISVSNLGYYVFEVNVSDDQPSSSTAFFQVLTNLTEDKDVRRLYFVSTGAELTFPCPVSGYPPPVVAWTKNDTQLQKGINAKFTINPVKDVDFGNYTCTATDGRASLGPFTIRVLNRIVELPVKSIEAEYEWSRQAGAKYYVVEVNGTDIRDDIVCGTRTSLEFHYNQFVFKNPEKKPDEIDICAKLTAIGDEGFIAKTSKCQKLTIKKNNQMQPSNSVTVTVTVQPSVMCLLLLLSVNWKIWY